MVSDLCVLVMKDAADSLFFASMLVRSLRSQVSFEKTFVSLAEIFTAGVLMSEIISSTNKLHFVSWRVY